MLMTGPHRSHLAPRLADFSSLSSNAIRALNICGGQVGHIPRGIASRLAPLLDQGVVRVEGVMAQGNLKGNPYKLDMYVASLCESF